MDRSQPFKWRHFQAEMILLCIPWSLRYALSSRDLSQGTYAGTGATY